ncbi:MAG: deoxyribose-phosphate aldolase [Lentisphaerae bacterium RIFOXYC12_FULL_60_16]|nr:MAG: deoxyribose-phosphate aldolase [Lentisphaerae bacterium RIFOXYC12_FULL_60_16]OGV83001.1 MAG: deoxyribose-phosphate aldolase [Lentisphaerae bacterium RIFOXYB12_FULL_60_10]
MDTGGINPEQNAWLAGLIDHTLLKPDATPAMVDVICDEAVRFGFKTVCINPCFVPRAVERIARRAVGVCTVVGFPLGAVETSTKVHETIRAIESGAREIDMVLWVGGLKAGDYRRVSRDIRSVVSAAGGLVVKVILETSLLTDAEKSTAARLAVDAGASFVKTSTGFNGGGATVTDIRLLREVVGHSIGVKASGGIRTRSAALQMVTAGADRIGTSAGISIMQAS